MSRLSRRIKVIEDRRGHDPVAEAQWRTPQAWTRRFLDADPAHAALVARISARPTTVQMCREPDGNTHLGHYFVALLHEATYDVDDNGKLLAVAMAGLPNQYEALELLNELGQFSESYQARTKDPFPIPFWGI